MDGEETYRTGFVALSGLPNAGKSTLLNQVLGQTISIVSPKPQTTRNRIVGIHTFEGAQIILVDTPGLTEGRRELDRRMLQGARAAVIDADIVVRVVDAARSLSTVTSEQIDVRPADGAVIVALNKVDRVRPKDDLLPMMQHFAAIEGVEAVVPISALAGDGVDALVEELIARLPVGPPLYPEDMVTDRPERFLVAELIRASVLKLTRQEVPHSSAVSVTAWRESDAGVHLEATVYVEKDSQRRIVIGRGGAMIKQIGIAAREEIGKTLGCAAHLKLRVEVSSGWRCDPRALAELGYDE